MNNGIRQNSFNKPSLRGSGRGRIGLLAKFLTLLFFLIPAMAHATRIGDSIEVDVMEQVWRFLSFRDPAVRFAVIGSILLGLTCGTLGSFIVVRRLALMGDALSHAVLPGVVIGFLWNMSKDPLAIFIGATLAGLLGTATVSAITHTTRLKEDAALGMVLAGFFAVGASLLTMTQSLPIGTQSGIHYFLFGQAAAMGPEDLRLMGVIAAIVVTVLFLFYKEFLVSSFDPAFGKVSGIPVKLMHHTLMLLLAFAVVISLQAVGVVLVSAMLIIPAATAYLLTERLSWMIILSAAFGIVAGLVGCFLSFLGANLPTGPFMVLASGSLFFLTFVFSPRHGIGIQAWRKLARRQRVNRENMLKAMYHFIENGHFASEAISLLGLKELRRETLDDIRRQTAGLRRNGLVTLTEEKDVAYFTPEGWKRASSIVRNHRLWELYLTSAADISPDRVHADAEKIEHILGEDTVRDLERTLDNARVDPHGKRIPSTHEVYQGKMPVTENREETRK